MGGVNVNSLCQQIGLFALRVNTFFLELLDRGIAFCLHNWKYYFYLYIILLQYYYYYLISLKQSVGPTV